MRYSLIEGFNIQNGESATVSVWTQGCPFRCEGCHNSHTWNYKGGKEWTQKEIDKVLFLLEYPFSKDLAILGGEALDERNIDDVTELCRLVKEKNKDTKIFVWTGNNLEDIYDLEIWKYVDAMIVGRFVISEKIDHHWYGSSNQFIACTSQSIIDFCKEGILVNRKGRKIK